MAIGSDKAAEIAMELTKLAIEQGGLTKGRAENRLAPGAIHAQVSNLFEAFRVQLAGRKTFDQDLRHSAATAQDA